MNGRIRMGIWVFLFAWVGFSLAMGGASSVEESFSYLELRLKDPVTDRPFTLVVLKGDLANFLAYRSGLTLDSLGRFKDPGAYRKFLTEEVPGLLDRLSRGEMEVSLEEFARFLSLSRFRSIPVARQYLHSHLFDRPMTFAEGGVGSMQELLERYFDPIPKSPCRVLKSEYERFVAEHPAFIGLILDQGYRVQRGDVLPLLTACPPE